MTGFLCAAFKLPHQYTDRPADRATAPRERSNTYCRSYRHRRRFPFPFFHLQEQERNHHEC